MMTSQGLSSWLSIKSDDIDCGLAADFDGSLSGLGVELGSSTYNMSEALLALPVFKQENLDPGLAICQANPPSHHGTQFVPREAVATSTWVQSSPRPMPRCPSSEEDGENACHSQDVNNDSPPSDVSGFSLELLRGALVASSESENREDSGHSGYQIVQQGSPPSTYSVRKGLQSLRFSSDRNRFQYILNAGTSPATKLNEETLTYLNQGQSYEIKLKKYGETSEHSTVKSIIRVVFHDRRLQYAELEQLQLWRLGRPGERLLDIDIPLSTGIFDVTVEANRLNSVSFKWEPNKECIVFVKVHCISTEFTPKKHGGEKGVPFRVQIETYNDDEEPAILHCASCQVKVFKPKGADRKQKTDRDKMEKRSGAEKEKYQPSYEVTVLSELPLDQAQSYLQQLAQQELLHADYNKKAVETTKKSSWPATTTTTTTTDTTVDRSARVVNFNISEPYSPASSVESLNYRCKDECSSDSHPSPTAPEQVEPLSTGVSAVEVTKWLHRHRFSSYVNVFQNFAGADLLRLTRDDLIQICGLVDGIRLNNALQSKNIRPKLTIYVSQTDESNKKPSPQPTLSTATTTTQSNQVPQLQRTLSDKVTTAKALKSSSPTPTTSASFRREVSVLSDSTHKVGGGRLSSGTSNLMAPSKRQFREAEEEEDLEKQAASCSKKQRTRTLRMSQSGVYHALYLDSYTVKDLVTKIATLFMVEPHQIIETFLAGPSGISILVTDEVVQNFVDQSRFHVEAEQDEDITTTYRLHMKVLE